MERQTYTVRETAEVLGIGLNSAYEAIAQGQIPALRIGNRLLVPRAALKERLAAQAKIPAPERE